MFIDYLRFVAFTGRLRSFFEEGLDNYADPSATTGQHLRFKPDFLNRHFSYRGYRHEEDIKRFKYELGLDGGPDEFSRPSFNNGGSPSTYSYRERNSLYPIELEIIIDIHPDQWTERYSEPRAYEGVPIIYRKVGPAKADFKSGDKIFDNTFRRSDHGTLCGIFQTSNNESFALTCGHVTNKWQHVVVNERRRIWKLPFWSKSTKLGNIYRSTLPSPGQSIGPVQTHLDASLIEIHRPLIREKINCAGVRPISTMLQEEAVLFRGATRSLEIPARVSAVTVRKSIDLLKDGQLRSVGDVLMLGHRQPMYIVQRVTRPGDSGAAVIQDSYNGPYNRMNQWHGMILGSDEGGAYATYSEHLWGWAMQETGDIDLNFLLEN